MRERQYGPASMVEITYGENPCKIIKEIYYPDLAWTKCIMNPMDNLIANKFTHLKCIMRKQAPNLSELEILKMLSMMNKEDIMDKFSEGSGYEREKMGRT